MKDQVFEGTIRVWKDTFGFIDYDSDGSRIDSIFYPGKNIIPDNLGRTGHGKIEGSPLRFKIIMSLNRGELRPTAVEVTPLFPSDVEDPEAHREVSRVERLCFRGVYLRRETGGQLYLSIDNILPEFRTRFSALRQGDLVWHGVKPPTKVGTQTTWCAVAGELYSRQEQDAFAVARGDRE